MLVGHFPEEKEGIQAIFGDMKGLTDDIGRFTSAGGQVDMSRFPVDFPYLFNSFNKTWGELVDARIRSPKLKAIVSAQWGYYGLPPSRLSSFYYALPCYGYLSEGGFYPKGTSQKISNAFVKFIEDHGGRVVLNTKVEEILLKGETVQGVRLASPDDFPLAEISLPDTSLLKAGSSTNNRLDLISKSLFYTIK